ncbi:MAG TPA: response regulator transcription factor [Thermoanaerobaculia bacterium]|nr:response regulator transcription factor [Thermoanaerobaculia bacterium]
MSHAGAPAGARRRRILIVEDDPKTAATLCLYLEHAGFEVAIASDGAAALRKQRADPADLVLLDVMLPEVDGLAVCRALRAESDVATILVTARTTESDKLEGLGAGADDYVSKPFSPREVVARVRAVLRRTLPGRDAGSRERIESRNIRLHLGSREAIVRGKPVGLTRAEFDLLAAFLRSPGRAFTRQELARRAFGPDYEALDRTVDAHVMRLRRKIESSSEPPLIVTVHGIGYKLADRAARSDG